jgi:hypothetical protein
LRTFKRPPPFNEFVGNNFNQGCRRFVGNWRISGFKEKKMGKIKLLMFGSLLAGFFAFVLPSEAMAAGVSLSAVPTAQTVTVGQTATYTIKINRDNYTDKVTLSATGLPSGVTATFSPNTTTAISSTLKLQTLTSTPVGIFNINVKATANAVTITPIVVKLTTQPVPSIAVTINPSQQFIIAGQSTFYDIAISRFNYDGKLTLTAENVPAGITIVFDPDATYGNSARMYLYSNGLPFWTNDYGMLVRVHNLGDGIEKLVPFQVHVNFGMVWAAQFGAPTDQAANTDYATDVTYDSAGNVYLTGYSTIVTTNDNDAWVAKFDSAGNQLWLRMIPNLVDDRPTDVFVDSARNVYIAGNTRAPNYDIFVVKLDPNAAQVPQVMTIGTPNEEGQSGLQFGVNSSGNTTLTAVMNVRSSNTGFRDFINDPAKFVNYDITRFVFDASFNRTSVNLVTDAVGNPKDLAVGGDGSIYVLSEDLSRINPIDHFLFVTSQVEKFNSPNGQNYHSQPIGPTQTNAFYGTRLKVDANGNVYAVGNDFRRQIDFQLYFSNSWMVKLNSFGTSIWQSQLPANISVPTEITSLDLDAAGNVFYVGFTFDSLSGTNPQAGNPANNMNARTDAWFAKYSGANGTQISLSQFNVNDKDGFNAVKLGALATIYFAGYTLNLKHPNLMTSLDALLIKCGTPNCNNIP